MPIDRALRILRPLAATLTSAGEAGVLHGALHPRDVFVPEDEDGLAGVTGFGIVQALEAAGHEQSAAATPVRRAGARRARHGTRARTSFRSASSPTSS